MAREFGFIDRIQEKFNEVFFNELLNSQAILKVLVQVHKESCKQIEQYFKFESSFINKNFNPFYEGAMKIVNKCDKSVFNGVIDYFTTQGQNLITKQNQQKKLKFAKKITDLYLFHAKHRTIDYVTKIIMTTMVLDVFFQLISIYFSKWSILPLKSSQISNRIVNTYFKATQRI